MLVSETSDTNTKIQAHNEELQYMLRLEQQATEEKARQLQDQEKTISIHTEEAVILRSTLEETQTLVCEAQ